MWQAFGLGLWAGYGLAIPVGAVAVLLIHRSAISTPGRGLAAVLGAVSADALYAVAAVLGGAAAARVIAPWQGAVTVVGAGLHGLAHRHVVTGEPDVAGERRGRDGLADPGPGAGDDEHARATTRAMQVRLRS